MIENPDDPDAKAVVPAPEPDNPLTMPTDRQLMVTRALQLINDCKVSQSIRMAYCREISNVIEKGRRSDKRSLINLMSMHVNRLSAHLYSPTMLRFQLEFENQYPANVLMRGERTARLVDRTWEKCDTDVTFGEGVTTALKFGAALFKQWVETSDDGKRPNYRSAVVMPWQFGVYNEFVNDLSRQPAMVQTIPLTMPEVWRRIYHLPNAKEMLARIKGHGKRNATTDYGNSFFHQVLSTSVLDTAGSAAGQGQSPIPGGVVNVASNMAGGTMAPTIGAETVLMHELWFWSEGDWACIQIIEPDILIAPVEGVKLGNILMGNNVKTKRHPFTLIQPNHMEGYFWGRSELTDIMEPQGLLSQWADDTKRLFGLQIDKIMGFVGVEGNIDEQYDQMRTAGYLTVPMGGDIKDFTPQMPPQTLEMLNMIIRVINMISGFDNILSGSGEPGVRAGIHADTLMKTASPYLRDRALLVERQCAKAADLTLAIMQAKDAQKYWTDGSSQETMDATSFLLSDLPDDRRVTVDSHTSSPIFADDHQNLIAFGMKAGIIDQESAIEALPFQNKDLLLQRAKERSAKQAQMLEQLKQTDPEAYAKAITGKR